jgi:hypothetical protein
MIAKGPAFSRLLDCWTNNWQLNGLQGRMTEFHLPTPLRFDEFRIIQAYHWPMHGCGQNLLSHAQRLGRFCRRRRGRVEPAGVRPESRLANYGLTLNDWLRIRGKFIESDGMPQNGCERRSCRAEIAAAYQSGIFWKVRVNWFFWGKADFRRFGLKPRWP